MSLGAAELGLKTGYSPRSPMGELVEHRGHLEALLEDTVLAPDSYVLGSSLFSFSFLL